MGKSSSFMGSGWRTHSFLTGTGYTTLQQYTSSLTFEEQMEWGMAAIDYLILEGTMSGFDPAMYNLVLP